MFLVKLEFHIVNDKFLEGVGLPGNILEIIISRAKPLL